MEGVLVVTAVEKAACERPRDAFWRQPVVTRAKATSQRAR